MLALPATLTFAGCEPFKGHLRVYEGAGRSSAPHFPESVAPLLEQDVRGSEDCTCTRGDCLAWQMFVLDAPLKVVQDVEYTLHLTTREAALTRAFRVGLLVLDPYARGTNNFAVRRLQAAM